MGRSGAVKSKRKNNWELIVESLVELGGKATAQELTEHFKKRHPESKPGNERRKPVNVAKDLIMLSVNAPARVNYSLSQPLRRRSDSGHEKDRIFLAGDGIYELYEPDKHGIWETFTRGDGKLEVRRLQSERQVVSCVPEADLPQNFGSQDLRQGTAVRTSVSEGKGGDFASQMSNPDEAGDSSALPSRDGGDSLEQICRVLDSLACKRPIFHSEADFQHALAWELGVFQPTAQIRLEVPSIFRERRASIDLLTRDESRVRFFELKYKTRGSNLLLNGEHFLLKKQSAQDQGASDFIKDVCRIEAFVDATPGSEGFAILLTNDPSYWANTFGANVIDREFKLVEGRELAGTLSWQPSAGPGSIGKRDRSHHLRGRYRIRWKNYSDLSAKGVQSYRYLCLHVTSQEVPAVPSADSRSSTARR